MTSGNTSCMPAEVARSVDNETKPVEPRDVGTSCRRPPGIAVDSATRPNAFWVSLAKLDLKPGAPVKKLTIANGEVFSAEVAGEFKAAEPFKFLPADAKH